MRGKSKCARCGRVGSADYAFSAGRVQSKHELCRTCARRELEATKPPFSMREVKKILLATIKQLRLPRHLKVQEEVVGEDQWILYLYPAGLFIDNLEPVEQESILGTILFHGLRVGYMAEHGGISEPTEYSDETIAVHSTPHRAIAHLISVWAEREAGYVAEREAERIKPASTVEPVEDF